MGEPITDPNDKGFWKSANIEALGTDAVYADWAPGPWEDVSALTDINGNPRELKSRPTGDTSQLFFKDEEFEGRDDDDEE